MAIDWAYRGLTYGLSPGLRLLLHWRARKGREDRLRLAERRGLASRERPPGAVLWMHAVSVGEALSALPLLERIRRDHAHHILFTTSTVAAARVVCPYLPARCIHQFLPMDHGPWTQRFLDHWRPNQVVWVESDFWPGLMRQVRQRGIPAALVNARISERSARRWKRCPWPLNRVLAGFRPCLAASEEQAHRLRALGAPQAQYVGNLKAAQSPPLANDNGAIALRQAFGERPRWVAASTHPGEEGLILAAHHRIRQAIPDLLTILVPRHPWRADELAARASRAGVRVVRRSQGALPQANHQLYLVDTLGELGVLYREAPVAFLGGSLVQHGGHNPFEAIQLNCAVVHGPEISNFEEVYRTLQRRQAAQEVGDGHELAQTLSHLLEFPALAAEMAARAQSLVGEGSEVIEAVYQAIQPLFDDSDAPSHAMLATAGFG
ncbi:3-deoxy-D-manno-octulosonic acid transferase [Aquisalimonas sp.]|uniref:3-deoxy-D-manno-octulosonic acid transferase n=1 Tax=Aquisalimonas sp. TaxID=1872621 RepID=UPI0025C12D16|nr:3-deoxy-D-manno-octulosonic acid transferase [Aquisalimonas sp.]